MRILIAEDEKSLNKILVSRLTAEHYSVDACFDGQEALDYLAGAEYDAVVLDIMMPVMDGLTVLRKIRARDKSLPVLLLTARDSIEDRVAGLDAGANDYLVKPFAVEELLARIRVMLRKPDQSGEGNCLTVGGSDPVHGHPQGDPGGERDQPVRERVHAAAVYDAEPGHRALPG